MAFARTEATRRAGHRCRDRECRDVGDLPRAIGRPATQALVSVGITDLDQVAELTEAELRNMHGVGPKAVRVLSDALHAAGRDLKS